MNTIKNLLLIILNLLLITVSGCISGTVEAQKEGEALAELYIGNSLPIVELNSLVTEKQLVPVSHNKAYSLDNRVAIEGEYYVFTIFTPHGTITAKSVAALVEYCYDSEVIEMMLASNFGDAIQDSMLNNVNYSNNEVVDMKVYKIDSIAGIGRRFNLEYSEDINSEIITDNIVDRNAIHLAFYDPKRMKLAYKLGLDAYSSNQYVQRFLDALALLSVEDLRELEKLDLVYPEINIQRGRKNIDASSQSRALFPASRSIQIESRLVNNDAPAILSKLRALYGASFSDVDIADTPLDELIYSSHYSIREELYIFAYLNDMSMVQNRKDVVALMAKADSAFTAKQFYLQLQLLHAYYASRGGLKKFITLSNMLGALDLARQIIVMPTWDHTRERDKVRKLLVEVKNIKETSGASGANVWFVGDCDKNTRQTAKKAGIMVESSVVLDPIFRFTNYRKLTYTFEKGDPLVQNAAGLTPNFVRQYERTNRPVPTTLLPDSQNAAKTALNKESTIVIEEPIKPKPVKHDPRNWKEFGIGVKIIPKEELAENKVPGIASDGVGDKFDTNETGSADGKLPPAGDDPIKVDSTAIF